MKETGVPPGSGVPGSALLIDMSHTAALFLQWLIKHFENLYIHESVQRKVHSHKILINHRLSTRKWLCPWGNAVITSDNKRKGKGVTSGKWCSVLANFLWVTRGCRKSYLWFYKEGQGWVLKQTMTLISLRWQSSCLLRYLQLRFIHVESPVSFAR
jgi:hypothetical protein